MRRLLIAALLAISPVMVAYSGTFVDDFSDGNLDGWHIESSPGPPFPHADLVKIRDGYLVIDTMLEDQTHLVWLKLSIDGAEKWDSYTLTCRVRFREVPQKPPVPFNIRVRRDSNVDAGQAMCVWMRIQRIMVYTFLPNDINDLPPNNGKREAIQRAGVEFEDLRRPIEKKRWYPVKIVAKKNDFEFYFDDGLVVEYEDKDAVPGTVAFDANGGIHVHLDDVAITGPRIPNIGGPHRVSPEARLATTWGEMKDLPRR
ncbi:MAG: hypothetical protein OXI86_01215 [Candidatus Poribacteria bacterium]|nr:hypothetical protein [Candidatus Poribacteria bacterium]